jgi:hypothetical protein
MPQNERLTWEIELPPDENEGFDSVDQKLKTLNEIEAKFKTKIK